MTAARPEIIERLMDHFGSAAVIGDKLGISSQTVYSWKRIPAEHCLKLEELAANRRFTRYTMRPDIFGKKP